MYSFRFIFIFLFIVQTVSSLAQSIDCHKNVQKLQALYKEKEYDAAIMAAQSNWVTCLAAQYEEGCYQSARVVVLSYIAKKKPEKAQKAIDAMIQQLSKEQKELLGKCYFLKGRTYDEEFIQTLALKYYQTSINYLTLSKIDTFSPPYNNLALAYGNLGDYAKQLQYLNKAVNINLKRGDTGKKELENNYNNLAEAYIHGFKNYEKGIEFAEKALSVTEHNNSALANNHLAWAYSELKQIKKAIYHHKKAENITTIASNNYQLRVSYSYYTLGHIYENNHQYNEALAMYEKYLSLSIKEKNKPDIVEAYAVIGHLQMKTGDYQAALASFQEGLVNNCAYFYPPVLEINPPKREQTTHTTAALLFAKGEAWVALSKKNPAKSFQYLKNALETHEAGFYSLRQAKSDFSEDLSKWNLIERYASAYESAIATTIELHERTCDNDYIEKAVHFANQSRSVSLRENLILQQAKQEVGIPDSLLRKEQILKQTIVQLERKAATTGITDSLFIVKRELDTYKTYIKGAFPKYYQLAYQSDAPLKLSDVQSILLYNQLMVLYYQGKRELYTFTIHPKRGIKYYRQSMPSDFEANFRKFRRTLSDWDFIAHHRQQAECDFLETSPILYDFLLKKQLADAHDCQKLIVIPDGKLSYIPFESLLTMPYKGSLNDRDIIKHYILSQYDVSRAYGVDILLHQYAQQSKIINHGSFSGFASNYEDALTLSDGADIASTNEEDENDFKKLALRSKRIKGTLPNAIKEINSAKTIWGGRVFLNHAATKSNFLRYAKNAGIVQLALHANLDDENPLNSSLIFTKQSADEDNFLTVGEIYHIDMPDELTVLNACSTGGGTVQNAEGIISIDRAFAQAGSKSLLTNLAEIDDKAVSFINKAFNNCLKTGLRKDEALRNAKLSYLQSPEVSSYHVAPIYWANSVITGNIAALHSHQQLASASTGTFFGWITLGISSILSAFFLRRVA
jgi:tetratricopeptide (TPR) repeat protein